MQLIPLYTAWARPKMHFHVNINIEENALPFLVTLDKFKNKNRIRKGMWWWSFHPKLQYNHKKGRNLLQLKGRHVYVYIYLSCLKL